MTFFLQPRVKSWDRLRTAVFVIPLVTLGPIVAAKQQQSAPAPAKAQAGTTIKATEPTKEIAATKEPDGLVLVEPVTLVIEHPSNKGTGRMLIRNNGTADVP